MANGGDEDEPLGITNLVENAVISHAQASVVLAGGEFHHAYRTRMAAQGLNGSLQARQEQGIAQLKQESFGGWKNAEGVGHEVVF